MGAKVIPNPACVLCGSDKVWKNKLVCTVREEGDRAHPWSYRGSKHKKLRDIRGVEVRGYYRCLDCNKYFYSQPFKLSQGRYDDVPNCHKCDIGRPAFKLGGHNTPYGRADTYRCLNCGERYTVSPCMGKNNPRLKRKISAKECYRLRTEEFLTYSEIAKIAGVTKNAVINLMGQENLPDW